MERVVVLSDLHLGEEGCSLKDENIILKLANELKSLGKIDQIILLGDIFDLSMASLSDTIKNGKSLFKALEGLDIENIVYVPGNHDHHFWVLEIENKDIIAKIINGEALQKPNYIREFKGKEFFISGVLPPSIKDRLIVKYPNHKVEVRGRKYLLHHGHYLSREGSLLCKTSEAISKGISLNEFELLNSPIHELIQYSLEQSPIMQEKIEKAWKGGGALAAIMVIVDEMMNGEGVWGRLIRWFSKQAQKGKKHSMRQAAIDDEMIERIRNYITLSKEDCNGFIFGHTHIPEEKVINGSFFLANSGSWLDEGKGAPNSYIVISDKSTIKFLEKKT